MTLEDGGWVSFCSSRFGACRDACLLILPALAALSSGSSFGCSSFQDTVLLIPELAVLSRSFLPLSGLLPACFNSWVVAIGGMVVETHGKIHVD